jgi:hypothetical protein
LGGKVAAAVQTKSYKVHKVPKLRILRALKLITGILLKMDVGFYLRRHGQYCPTFVECKYRDKPQGLSEIKPYIDTAKSENSVLTFFVAKEIHDDLKVES